MKKWFQLSFQFTLILVALSGVLIDIFYQYTVLDGFNMFAYFTIQSNILIAFALMGDIYYRLTDQRQPHWFVVFRSGSTLCIILTGLVYHLLLSRIHHAQGIFIFPNIGLHYITPIGMFLDWLLFEEKGQYRYRYAVYWLAYPMIYALGSIIRGSIDGFYPYWFVNPTQAYPLGTGSLFNLLLLYGGLSFVFYLLGMFMIMTDKLIVNRLYLKYIFTDTPLFHKSKPLDSENPLHVSSY